MPNRENPFPPLLPQSDPDDSPAEIVVGTKVNDVASISHSDISCCADVIMRSSLNNPSARAVPDRWLTADKILHALRFSRQGNSSTYYPNL